MTNKEFIEQNVPKRWPESLTKAFVSDCSKIVSKMGINLDSEFEMSKRLVKKTQRCGHTWKSIDPPAYNGSTSYCLHCGIED